MFTNINYNASTCGSAVQFGVQAIRNRYRGSNIILQNMDEMKIDAFLIEHTECLLNTDTQVDMLLQLDDMSPQHVHEERGPWERDCLDSLPVSR